MLLKPVAFMMALLLLGSTDATCPASCRSDGVFLGVQIEGYMVAQMKYGAILSGTIRWTFSHGGYTKSLSYPLNVFSESKIKCSSDEVFCVNDRLAIGKEEKFGYTLYYGEECSNYWGGSNLEELHLQL
ncbi:hypothetical protein BGW42_007621 [Actinomortierella wolfii]|nr:hypothetical protein BGW42_007621 [Actinomortierella wolfii]